MSITSSVCAFFCLLLQVERLIKEIGTRGRLNTGKKNLAVPGECERQSTRGDSMCSDLSLSSSTSSLHSYMRLPTALSWSQTEVQQWLTSHHLSHVADRSVMKVAAYLPYPMKLVSFFVRVLNCLKKI